MGAIVPIVLVLLSVALTYFVHASAAIVFVVSIVAIVPVANWMRAATEQIAHRAGSTVGGLLNVTFGNMSELIIAMFILAKGEHFVVKGQITGSIIGNSLLGLGIGIFAGGLGHDKQVFRRERSGLLSSLLILSVIGLTLPSVFDYTERGSYHNLKPQVLEQRMSLGVSIVLILVYIANLIYTFITHKAIFTSSSGEEEHTEDLWPLWKSVGLLVASTAILALEAEIVAGALEETAHQLHLSTFFLGVTVLAVVGNAGEYISSVYFARKNKIGMVMSITVGSSIQMALLVAPLLVIGSYFVGPHPMSLVFSTPLELVSLTAVAFAVSAISQDGETNWFEGVMLLGVYLILAIAFYFVAPG